MSLLTAAQFSRQRPLGRGHAQALLAFLGQSGPAGELRALRHQESFSAGCFHASHVLFLIVVLKKVHVSRNRGRVRMPASDITATYPFSTYPVPDIFYVPFLLCTAALKAGCYFICFIDKDTELWELRLLGKKK